MSDSTIDDALKLLEKGKGNPDRIKRIIESFQKRSLISLEDRKYIDALVTQYLTQRQRVTIRKKEPEKEQTTSFPRIRKAQEGEYKVPENKFPKPNLNQTDDFTPEIEKPNKNISNFEEYEKEYVQRVSGETGTSLEERFIDEIEKGPQPKRKSSSGKNLAIVGIIAVIIIGGGAGALFIDFDSDDEIVVMRTTCDDTQILVSSTKIPGFPDPEKDLQHYLDRYNNEPSYADWFDRNFPELTITDVLVKQKSDTVTKIPGFPDPEKDLQHYLDRYNNEPSYADWFDRNFPGMAIEEAVC